MPLYLSLSILIFSLGIIIDSAEILINFNLYNKGLISDTYIKNKYRKSTEGITKLVIFFSTSEIFRKITTLRLIISALLLLNVFLNFFQIIPSNNTIFASILFFFIILIELVIRLRNKFGLTAADNVNFYISIVFFVALLLKNTSFLHYISIYIVISYFLTGYNKLFSIFWRKGTAITQVLSTETFGSFYLFKLMLKYKRLSFIMSWMLIIFQLLFIISIPFPDLLIVFLIMGITFHLSLAIIMKLYNFLFSFLATYPILYFSSLTLNHLILSNI